MRFVAAGLICLCVPLIASIPARADSGCGVDVLFAQLVGVGKTHGYGEYLVQLTPMGTLGVNPKGALGPLAISLTAANDGGQTTVVTTDGIFVTSPIIGSASAILLVLRSPSVRSFAVDSVGPRGAAHACSPADRYDISKQFGSSQATFDDDASWVKVGMPIAVQLDGPKWVYRAEPDNVFKSQFSDEADASMALVIDADGSLESADVVRSPGDPKVDAASMQAARASRFSPAHLPAAFGGTAVAAVVVVIYTFINQ